MKQIPQAPAFYYQQITFFGSVIRLNLLHLANQDMFVCPIVCVNETFDAQLSGHGCWQTLDALLLFVFVYQVCWSVFCLIKNACYVFTQNTDGYELHRS